MGSSSVVFTFGCYGRPMLPAMANSLKVLDIRLMPGERSEYAMPFDAVPNLSALRNLEDLYLQVTGGGNQLLDPFCTFTKLRCLQVRMILNSKEGALPHVCDLCLAPAAPLLQLL
jgi:hypothetical protein